MIARIFPTKTSMSPDDPHAYFGPPNLITPLYKTAYISVTFTWDKEKAHNLAVQWKKHAGEIKIGGPAFGDPGGEFTPGMFLNKNCVITHRGCPNNCWFCSVPKREGKIRELRVNPGYINLDSNLLACSDAHIDRVFKMFEQQKRRIYFKGGIEAARITDKIVDKFRSIRVGEIFLAYDQPSSWKPLKAAAEKLSKYFKPRKLRCFVLIGYEGDTINKAEERLRETYNLGMWPFAMRYRKLEENFKGSFVYTDRSWNLLQYTWTRPGEFKREMKGALQCAEIP